MDQDTIQEFKNKLKAQFSADWMGLTDVSEGGCPTCGFGGTEAMTLKTIHKVIDNFDPSKFDED